MTQLRIQIRRVSDDAFEADDWEALSTLLTDTFGAYAFDLGAVGGTDALLDATLSEFDGPKIAILSDVSQSTTTQSH